MFPWFLSFLGLFILNSLQYINIKKPLREIINVERTLISINFSKNYQQL